MSAGIQAPASPVARVDVVLSVSISDLGKLLKAAQRMCELSADELKDSVLVSEDTGEDLGVNVTACVSEIIFAAFDHDGIEVAEISVDRS